MSGSVCLSVCPTSLDESFLTEDELQKLAEPGAVVVHHSLGVPESLKNRINLSNKHTSGD